LHLFFLTCRLCPELDSELCADAKRLSSLHGDNLKSDFVRWNLRTLKTIPVLSDLTQALDEMGMFVQQNPICQQTGYIIDLFVESRDKTWLIQYHGEDRHIAGAGAGNARVRRAGSQQGELKLQRYLLSCVGYKIVAITSSEWDDVKMSKKSIRSYLAWKLGLV
ncbi:hypothetical protein GUITHDRAFT_152118, partial [Guillardia theta CCMP2712]